jgi:hypothetical protein
MSWGAQNRSKDAKTPSASRGRSRKPKPALCGIQPYLQRQNTWEENRCRLSHRDLSCCVEPTLIGSKEQTTLANHQSTIHCPLFPPRTSDPTTSGKRRGLASLKRLAVLTVKRSDRLVVLCAARTADGGRSSEMTARLP